MILISLGSNSDAEHNIQMVEERLRGFFLAIRFSGTIVSDAIGMPEGTPQYANALAQIYTDPRDNISLDTLKGILKMLETEAGRNQEDEERGLVALDLDILLYETSLFKPDDWHRPYNQTLLKELGL